MDVVFMVGIVATSLTFMALLVLAGLKIRKRQYYTTFQYGLLITASLLEIGCLFGYVAVVNAGT